jgi:hypothetical protein
MITTEEIAIKVRQMLIDGMEVNTDYAENPDYQRKDYSKEGIVIVPRSIDGEGSVRNGSINVNIHVPDIPQGVGCGKALFHTNFARLIELRKAAMEILQNHYEHGCGYNWVIGLINPPMQEPNHNEHFVSFSLDIVVREKKSNN